VMVPGAVDRPGAAARFDEPPGLALDDAGHLFVCDRGNQLVRRVTLASGEVTTVAGAAGQADHTDGAAGEARFHDPAAAVYLPGEPAQLYVADAGNAAIRAIDLVTGRVTTPLGSAGPGDPRDGVGNDARFDVPAGLVFDPTGTLYVSDANAIRRVDLRSRSVRTFVGSGKRGVVLDRLPASLNQPVGLALAGGALWISNLGEQVIVSAHAE
jgi:DNA-binding beta-propeller fold protein YncE